VDAEAWAKIRQVLGKEQYALFYVHTAKMRRVPHRAGLKTAVLCGKDAFSFFSMPPDAEMRE
jgi:hypothetical protein